MTEDYATQVASLLEALQGERLEVVDMQTEQIGKSNLQQVSITFRDLAIPAKKVPKTMAKPSKKGTKPPGRKASKVTTRKSKQTPKIAQKQPETTPAEDKPKAPFYPEMADMIQL
jgi:hypothetical protein